MEMAVSQDGEALPAVRAASLWSYCIVEPTNAHSDILNMVECDSEY